MIVACGESAAVLKALSSEGNEVVLRGVDVTGGIFMAIRGKDGTTVFLTSPIESQGKALCIVSAIKQSDMKVEKHFGKPTGLDS